MKIFKYKLDSAEVSAQGSVTVYMPAESEVLSAAAIGGEIFVWAAVTPGKATARKGFRIVPTGHPIPDSEVPNLRFVDTVLIPSITTLVFHIFEEI